MADLPPPVGRTARTSRPTTAAAAARSCPGRSRLNPKRSRASAETCRSTDLGTGLPVPLCVVRRLEPCVPQHPPEVDQHLDVDVLSVWPVEHLRLAAERNSISPVRLFDNVAD